MQNRALSYHYVVMCILLEGIKSCGGVFCMGSRRMSDVVDPPRHKPESRERDRHGSGKEQENSVVSADVFDYSQARKAFGNRAQNIKPAKVVALAPDVSSGKKSLSNMTAAPGGSSQSASNR